MAEKRVQAMGAVGPDAVSARKRSWNPLGNEAHFAYSFLVPLVLFLILAAIFPLIYSLWISFHQVPFSLEPGAWQFVGLQNFVDAVLSPESRSAVLLSVVYAASVTFMCLILSLAGALILNEQFRGRKMLLLVSILPMALSTYATAILWRYIYSESLGMLNAVLTNLNIIENGIQYITPSSAIFLVAVAHSWQMAPFGMTFFLAALQVIPPDMYRVARVDRLGLIGRFRHVTFPYLRGTIIATSVLFMIAAFKVFDIIYFLTVGGPGNASTTMTYRIYLQTFRAYNYGYGSAQGFILLLILVILLVIYFVFYTREQTKSST